MSCRIDMYLIFSAAVLSSISLIFVKGNERMDTYIDDTEPDRKEIDLITIIKQQKQMLLHLATDLGNTKNAVADLSYRVDQQHLLIIELKEENRILRKEILNTFQVDSLDLLLRTNKFSEQEHLDAKEENNTNSRRNVGKRTENKAKTFVKLSPDRKITDRKKNEKLDRRLVLNSGGPVAFHAVNDREEIPHLSGQPVPFDTVLLNLGGAYHSSGSIFIANRDGIYIFSASILSFVDSNAEFMAQIIKNNVVLACIYGHGDSHRHDQGSATVVVQLSAGDEVWIKLIEHDITIWGNRYTTFTGALLWTI